ncbi:hypothetical protein FSP39_022647 [Pinctada imbricata]|uniref:Cytochrome P450 n=1 Tax=Pinctada imbricata TaxID=66713 RepID=A0AA89C9C6_PINIB|nr:hypothetical protein FSP39_022647 [Pinctada imbricata]
MNIHEIYNKWMVSDISENLSSLVICTTFLFVVYLVKMYMENKNLPPGPWGIPLLGHMTLLGKNPLTTFDDYRRQYGDIYRLRFGSWPVVVISGKDAIKTALQYNGDTLSDRPELLSVRKISGMKGIAFCHNDQSHVLLRKKK